MALCINRIRRPPRIGVLEYSCVSHILTFSYSHSHIYALPYHTIPYHTIFTYGNYILIFSYPHILISHIPIWGGREGTPVPKPGLLGRLFCRYCGNLLIALLCLMLYVSSHSCFNSFCIYFAAYFKIISNSSYFYMSIHIYLYNIYIYKYTHTYTYTYFFVFRIDFNKTVIS